MSTFRRRQNQELATSWIAWFEKTPHHWGIQRLGRLFRESSQRASNRSELEYPILSVSIHDGISDTEKDEDDLDRKVPRSDDRSLYKVVKPNDLTYNMMRAWQGGFGAAQVNGLISPAYVVCKPRTSFPSRYFELLLRTPAAVTELKRYSRGITDFRLRLYWDDFKKIDVVVPPTDEQYQILKFLDYETAKIDTLINKQRQLIAMLGEKRQAVISHAVTKGLNPDAPTRDSGVEWLGVIPRHWKNSKLRNFATFYTGSTPDRSVAAYWNGDVPWVKTGEINYNLICDTEEKISRHGLSCSSCSIAPAGTLLMALYGQGVTRGRVALLGIPAAFNQACVAITPDSRVRADFLHAFFLFAYHHIRIGNETTQMNMNVDFVRRIPIVVPPIKEQVAIVDDVARTVTRFDLLHNSATNLIELLQERRSALISAAVTGKIDVRGWKRPSSDAKLETEMDVA